jgi:hypothetical protein
VTISYQKPTEMNHIKCPICGSTEVYRISRLVIPEPEGRETVYHDCSLARSEEPGNYECVDGHQWKIEMEEYIINT